jgi:hypothetical protein
MGADQGPEILLLFLEYYTTVKMQETETNKCDTPRAVPSKVCFLLCIKLSVVACTSILISYDILKVKVKLALCLTK